jgi:hypothetical protein
VSVRAGAWCRFCTSCCAEAIACIRPCGVCHYLFMLCVEPMLVQVPCWCACSRATTQTAAWQR